MRCLMSRVFRYAFALICMMLFWIPACGGEESGEEESGVEEWETGESSGTEETTETGETAETGEEELPASVEYLKTMSGGKEIHFTRYVPEGCGDDSPCPLVVLTSGGLSSGDVFFEDKMPATLAAKSGVVVVTFNSPGRGTGPRKSQGEEDYNGPDGQDALSDVLNYMIKNLKTNDRVGVVSFGFGLSTASGALGRFGPTKLAEVDFLIDVEGPVNRCFITAAPLDLDGDIDGDGPGVNDERCDFAIGPREEAFPFDLPNGAPPSVICHEGAFPISLTGMNCTEDTWWGFREPSTYLSKMSANYLRLQMIHDHAQASRWSALEAIRYAILSDDVEYHQLNDVQPGLPLHSPEYGDASCVSQGCYLDFSGAGLGNNLSWRDCDEIECSTVKTPFAAASEDLKSMSLELFFEHVLHQYVDRMVALDD
jgi:hypothetical protein